MTTTKTKLTQLAPDEVTTAYVGDIVKTEKTADGLMVYGKVTGPDVDLDGQICDPDWLKTAMPDWMVWGNVREQHGHIAAGVGKELTETDGGDWMLKALIVDPGTIKKVETGVLKGYSIHVKGASVVRDRNAPGGRINGGVIVENSLVDRPCLPTATMSIAKAFGAGLGPVDAAGAELAKSDGAPEEAEPVERPAVAGPVEVTPEAEPLSDDDQMAADAMAKSAQVTQLAAREVPAEIQEVQPDAPAVGSTLTPSAYRKAAATMAGVLSGDIRKRAADESGDIAAAQAVIAQLARLIMSEATELAAGRMEEADDIACLMDAVRAVKYFLWNEREQDGREVPGPALATIQLAASADANKSATVTPEDVVTTAVPDVTELVKAAVAEANRVSEDRYKAIEAELVKVRAMPIPGGPMILPTAGTGAPARPTSEQTLVKRYRALAEQSGDPNVQSAYRALAESIAKS
jgi:hypothetical protein